MTRSSCRHAIAVSVCLLLAGTTVESRVITGQVTQRKTQWQYLGRFAMDIDRIGRGNQSVSGQVVFQMNWLALDVRPSPFEFLSYLEDGYDRVKNDPTMTCEEMRQLAHSKQMIDPLRTTTTTLTYWQISRPHMWTWAIANCSAPQGLPVGRYSLHATNVQWSEWNRELGYNELGLQDLHLVFVVVYAVLLLAVGTSRGPNRNTLDNDVFFWTHIMLWLQMYSTVMMLIYSLLLSTSGLAVEWMALLARLVDHLSGFVFMMLLSRLTHLVWQSDPVNRLPRHPGSFFPAWICFCLFTGIEGLTFAQSAKNETVSNLWNLAPLLAWAFAVLAAGASINAFAISYSVDPRHPLSHGRSLIVHPLSYRRGYLYALLLCPLAFAGFALPSLLRMVVDPCYLDISVASVGLIFRTLVYLFLLAMHARTGISSASALASPAETRSVPMAETTPVPAAAATVMPTAMPTATAVPI